MEIIRDPYLVLDLPLYELDGASFMSKESYGHVCTVAGATWGLQGMAFDGVSGLITVPAASSIGNIWTTGGTAEFWLYLASDGENNSARLAEKVTNSKNLWNSTVASEAAGKLKVTFSVGWATVAGAWATTATELTINTWTHLVIVYTASSVNENPIFYINNVAKTVGSGLTETATPEGTYGNDAAADLILGNRSGDDRTTDGIIGEIRLYTRVLSIIEIQHNYLATKWRYK